MAEKKAPAKPEKTAKAGSKKGLPLFVIMLLGIIGLGALPVTLILIAGLIPTLVMAFTDRNPARHLTVCVGALNLVGISFVVLQMVKKGYGLDYALQLLIRPENWAIMLGGAALGYAIHTVIPPLVAQVLAAMAEGRVGKLKTNQQDIKKSWGAEVSGGA